MRLGTLLGTLSRFALVSALGALVVTLSFTGCKNAPETPCEEACTLLDECWQETVYDCATLCARYADNPFFAEYADCLRYDDTCEAESKCGKVSERLPLWDVCRNTDGRCGPIIPTPDLTNNDPDCKLRVIHGTDQPGRLWLYGRLTPPSYPYLVEKVQIVLAGGPLELDGDCQLSAGTAVEMFIHTTPELPPLDVNVINEIVSLDPPKDAIGFHPFEIAVDPPLTLQQGDDMYVGINFHVDWPEDTCVAACEDSVYHPDRNYWADSSLDPSWEGVHTLAGPFNLRVGAYGHPL